MNNKRPVLFILFACLLLTSANVFAKNKSREYYQVIVYHFTSDAQERMMDDYLKNTFVPALHKMNNKNIGVFKPLANDTAPDKLIYVIVPFKKADQALLFSDKLQNDAMYKQASQYFDTSYRNPPYNRIETIILQAFSTAPAMILPKLTGPKSERIYELRSYESATEKSYRNKVQMFNLGGETKLFNRLNFNAIFYGEVIAGSRMPNLMYMTSFENKTDRDAHWKAFSADPEWKTLSALPEYQHNTSKINVYFLRAADYSDY